jgi:hypothetical protein
VALTICEFDCNHEYHQVRTLFIEGYCVILTDSNSRLRLRTLCKHGVRPGRMEGLVSDLQDRLGWLTAQYRAGSYLGDVARDGTDVAPPPT